MVSVLQEFKNNSSEITHFTKDMVDDVFNLCHYWPIEVKRDKNASSQMYRVFTSSRADDHKTSKAFQDKIKLIESHQIYYLLEILAKKIEEKFHKVADAYMYFSTYSTHPG
jgi:hypothetical protein